MVYKMGHKPSLLRYCRKLITSPFGYYNLDHCGFSLISILISMGIMGIVLSSILSIMLVQNNENLVIKQRLARVSLQSRILQSFRVLDSCSCQFRNTIIPEVPPPSITITELQQFYRIAPDPAAPPPPLPFPSDALCLRGGGESIAQAGSRVGFQLLVDSIDLINLRQTQSRRGTNKVIEGVNSGQNRREFEGTLLVSFNQTQILPRPRPMRPIEIPLKFTVGSNDIVKECGTNTYSEGIVARADVDFKARITRFKTDNIQPRRDRLTTLQGTANGKSEINHTGEHNYAEFGHQH